MQNRTEEWGYRGTSRRWLQLGLAALIWAAATLSMAGEQLHGRVVGVIDGDTVDVLDAGKVQHRIRLAGIDAPEKGMPYGQKSKQHLSDLVFGREVTVEGDKLDRYHRVVGKIVVNGRDANLAQVSSGMAWHYKQYQKEQSPADRQAYAEAEDQAHQAHKGLWADKEPVPPWEWRKSHRGKGK